MGVLAPPERPRHIIGFPSPFGCHVTPQGDMAHPRVPTRPHSCRTLEFLMRHLLRMASYSHTTNMHARNLAIVWAPNLLR